MENLHLPSEVQLYFDWKDASDIHISLWIIPLFAPSEGLVTDSDGFIADKENIVKDGKLSDRTAFSFDGRIADNALEYIPNHPKLFKAMLKMQTEGLPSALSKLLFVFFAKDSAGNAVSVRPIESVRFWAAIPSSRMDIYGDARIGEEISLSGSALDGTHIVPFEAVREDGTWIFKAVSVGFEQYRAVLEQCGLEVPVVETIAAASPVMVKEVHKAVMTMTQRPMVNAGKISYTEPKAQIELDPYQRKVFDIMESSRDNIFVTGKAGSGKSVLLRYCKEHTLKDVIILAPTGIAAINIGGQTIHSLFALGYTALDPDDITNQVGGWHKHMNRDIKELLQKTDAFIIDEISMVRSDVMECINRKFQLARGSHLPFGGVQMIAFGDLYQLPPIVVGETREYLDSRFGGALFFDAPVIKNSRIKIYELEKIHRQKEKSFQDMLDEVRVGKVSQATFDKFNRHVGSPASDVEVLKIATTNHIVNNFNDSKFKALGGKEHLYDAQIIGDVSQINNQIDKVLCLKIGARVMMLRNLYQDKKLILANGTIGEVCGLDGDEIKVNFGGAVYNIERASWETHQYQYSVQKGTLTTEKVGEFIQFPLKLAWAITIHKSQGQTYETVDVDFGTGAFAHGQAYVALSRCTKLENLYLTKPLKRSDIKVDGNVEKFMREYKVSVFALEDKFNTIGDTDKEVALPTHKFGVHQVVEHLEDMLNKARRKGKGQE